MIEMEIKMELVMNDVVEMRLQGYTDSSGEFLDHIIDKDDNSGITQSEWLFPISKTEFPTSEQGRMLLYLTIVWKVIKYWMK